MTVRTLCSALMVAGLTIAASLLGSGGIATAQPFPSKPITLVVGYTAGGQADALARVVAKQLSEALKTPLVVENKPGANGVIAAKFVAGSKPDGHTLLFVTDAMTTIDPQLPGSAKYDVSAELDPLINLASAPLFLAAHKDVPADSIAALAELGKKKGSNLAFGTSGSATPHRLAGEMLQKLGGFKMLHVPYKGTAASVTDLAGGQIPLVVGSVTALEPMARAGKIKMLAVTTEKRFPLNPDVPSIAETFPGFDVSIYLGLMVPKGTPSDVVAKLNAEINRILAAPDLREAFEKLGVVPVGGSPSDFKARIAADFETRGKLIRELDIRSE